jgi:hypothetical protein
MATREITLYATSFGADVGPMNITDNFGTMVATNVSPSQIINSINLTVDILADTIFLTSTGRCDNTFQVAINAIAPSPTVSPSITISPSVTPSVTPSISITPSVTPSVTISVSTTPSITISPTRTPSTTVSPSATPSISISRTPSITPSKTPSVTPSSTPAGLYYRVTDIYDGSSYYGVSSIDYCEITSNHLLIEILSYNGSPVTSHPDYAFTIREVINGGSPNYYILDIFNGSSSAQWNYTGIDTCTGYSTVASVSSSPLPVYVP